MTIPLHSKIMEILKKYEFTLSKKTDQKYNEHKKVCQKLK
jgi:hypothetical protein